MKWLVFSDSHGDLLHMEKAVVLEKPDRILHLGDVSRDAERLRSSCPDIPFEMVRGNCDGFYGDAPEEREVFLREKRVWMLHGHTYHVKYSTSLLVSEARTRGVDVVVFGHTHQPLCDWDGGLWVMNPGTVSGMPRATYGVIELEGDRLSCRVAEIKLPGSKKRSWLC